MLGGVHIRARTASLTSWVARMGAFLAAWQVLIWVFNPSPIGFPSPLQVARAFLQILEVGFIEVSLLEHIWTSSRRLLMGYAACLIVGIPAGFLMARIDFLRNMLTPFITLFRPLPSFAWLALLVAWFGFEELPKVAVVYVATVTIMMLGTMDAVRRVPPHFRDAARVLGAGRGQLFLYVVIPAAMPQILSSARVALTVAWSAVIAAELVAAGSGLGVIIIQSARFIRTDQTFAGLITLGIVGGLTDRMMAALQRSVAEWGNR